MNRSGSSAHGPWQVFLIFLRLGLTSFGGPIAHLAYFRDEFVTRRQWLSERSYADLLALCQFLPGPASSQVGIALGLSRCGYAGALAAWAGFTLPSALALTCFALGIASYGAEIPFGVLHGLKIVAVAVVAQAVWGMARHLCTGMMSITVMLAASGFILLLPSVWGQVGVIGMAALVGLCVFKPQQQTVHDSLPISIGKRVGLFWLALFFALLLGLPLLAACCSNQALAMIDAFYRAGSLVFGGGHVVLPMLQAELVPRGWVSNDAFLAGYGAAQAVPGPLFSFAAFLGTAMSQPTQSTLSCLGGVIALLAIFAPSFLLLAGTLPFWQGLRRSTRIQAALLGVNAAVVGLLLAALYQPVWTSAIHSVQDVGFAVLALLALMYWKLAPWLLVLCSVVLGWLLSVVF